MDRTVRVLSSLVCLVMIVLFVNGCAYLSNRGRDALDIMDIGITFNNDLKPRFGLYIDFFNILPLGYSNVEGKSFGIGNRQIGLLDFQHKSWGVIAWGSEQKGSGEFNPQDPHQARPDQAGESQRPRFNTGIVRMASEDNAPPVLQFLECDRVLHLGWIGIHATMRPFDIIDFILGWTTLDIMKDDNIQKLE